MSTYEQMMGMGASGVTPLPKPLPMGPAYVGPDLKAFAAKLSGEKGPFVFIGEQEPDGQRFLAWLMLTDQGYAERLVNIELLKMGFEADPALKIPEWVKGSELRVSKELYDKYLSCTARMKRAIAKQGAFMAASLPDVEIIKFMDWWRAHDTSGAAALMVLYADPGALPGSAPTLQIPKQLFNFWQSDGGKSAPPKELLGFEDQGWLGWALDNWLWIAGGMVGGAAAAGWYANRRSGVNRNPLLENMREGWGQTLKLKSGTYNLHPILTKSYVRSMTAMNMRNARKFRVSSEGKSLGELHKSGGRYSWRARSYFGAEKYGNSRAALLAWLKDEAPVEALAQREAELMEGVHIPLPMANNKREVF